MHKSRKDYLDKLKPVTEKIEKTDIEQSKVTSQKSVVTPLEDLYDINSERDFTVMLGHKPQPVNHRHIPVRSKLRPEQVKALKAFRKPIPTQVAEPKSENGKAVSAMNGFKIPEAASSSEDEPVVAQLATDKVISLKEKSTQEKASKFERKDQYNEQSELVKKFNENQEDV